MEIFETTNIRNIPTATWCSICHFHVFIKEVWYVSESFPPTESNRLIVLWRLELSARVQKRLQPLLIRKLVRKIYNVNTTVFFRYCACRQNCQWYLREKRKCDLCRQRQTLLAFRKARSIKLVQISEELRYFEGSAIRLEQGRLVLTSFKNRISQPSTILRIFSKI